MLNEFRFLRRHYVARTLVWLFGNRALTFLYFGKEILGKTDLHDGVDGSQNNLCT